MLQDPWWEIRPIIEGFNACRKKAIEPGPHIVVDEVMSKWQGADANWVAEGLPHVTKLQRKPEGVGAEMKSVCDGETNIMLGLDIMEGKEVQVKKNDFVSIILAVEELFMQIQRLLQ